MVVLPIDPEPGFQAWIRVSKDPKGVKQRVKILLGRNSSRINEGNLSAAGPRDGVGLAKSGNGEGNHLDPALSEGVPKCCRVSARGRDEHVVLTEVLSHSPF